MKSRAGHIVKRQVMTGGGLVILLLLFTWAITLPPFQTWLVKKATGYLSEFLGVPVQMEGVHVALPHNAVIKGLQICDRHQQPMLTTKELRLDLISFSLWKLLAEQAESQRMFISSVSLVEPDLLLYRSTVDSQLNLQFLLNSLMGEPDTTKAKKPFTIELGDVNISGGEFRFIDSLSSEVDSIGPGRIRFQHMALEDIHVQGKAIIGPFDRLEVDLAHLGLRELYSGFWIEHVSGQLLADTTQQTVDGDDPISQPFVRISSLELEAAGSKLLADIAFDGKTLNNAFRFDEGFAYRAEVKSGTSIDFSTINYFTPQPIPLEGIVEAQGALSGTKDDLNGKNLDLRYGSNTRVKGSVTLEDLLHADQSHLEVDLTQSLVSLGEIQTLLPDVPIPDFLEEIDSLTLAGSYKGTYRDFRVNAEVESKLGWMDADLHFMIPPVTPILSYEGKVISKGLNLNRMGLDAYNISPDLNFQGNVKGKGTDLENMELAFDASVINSHIRGVLVDSVMADLTIANRQIAGTLYGESKETEVDLDVNFDLLNHPNNYELKGDIKQFDLREWGIVSDSFVVSSLVDIDLRGDSVDEVIGLAQVNELMLMHAGRKDTLQVPALDFQATVEQDGYRYINLKSSLLDADLAGFFGLKQAGMLVQQLAYETQLYVTNADSLLDAYYADKVMAKQETDLKFGIAFKDSLNQVFDFFHLGIELEGAGLATGELQFRPGQDSLSGTEQLNLAMHAPKVKVGSVVLDNNQLDLDLIKQANSNLFFLAGGLHVDTCRVSEDLYFRSVGMDIQGAENHFETDLVAGLPDNQSEIALKVGTLLASDGSIRSALEPYASHVTLPNDSLYFEQGDSMVLHKGVFDIRNLVLQNDRRYFRLDGEISKNPDSELTLSIGQLDLGMLGEALQLAIKPEGFINSEIVMSQLLEDPHFQLDGRIDGLKLDDQAYGNIFVDFGWQQSTREMELDAKLVQGEDTTLVMSGAYDLQDRLSPLQFTIVTEREFPLEYISPFVKGQLYGIQGRVALEEFSITGTLESPVISGIGHFNDAGFGVDYFKTKYRFDGDIMFENDRISFPRIKLYDENDHTAIFYGDILHKGLRDLEFDLQLDTVQNFLIMNTTKDDNDLFYGEVYIDDGIGSITGNLERLSVTAFASVGEGSHLRIPVSDVGSYDRPDYIRFVSDRIADSVTRNTGLQGFDLNLNISANEKGQVDLIFDEKVGDIIRGWGNGTLTMVIDESGDFGMFGRYEIAKGDYLFTAQDIINKKFKLKPGGSIFWDGDPFSAIMDIEAIYSVNAEIKDLLNQTNSVRTPVNVLMNLKGELLEPEIKLSIELPNLTDSQFSDALSVLRMIENDEAELNKQVFSLMVFKRFAPIGSSLGDDLAGSGVTSSISELLTNQVNYWISKATGDKVNIGVGTTDFQDVSLLISAQLFGDRVTIERDGTLVDLSEDNSSFNLGNIKVIIKLLPAANQIQNPTERPSELVLEVFNRERYSSINQEASTANNETGLGIFYKKDFDRLSELFPFLKKKKRSKLPKNEPEQTVSPLTPVVEEDSTTQQR
ncbi:translocation/assembly module TamB domain-containing protein [Pontibacter sp. G13]|uniref:translocation/assembly module TamB domain-containing protein n=1 Tax=Pontibacter sp. G13 TaxID=3074898 RepID=UPI00288C00A1|nr:translocation/assembly module TamB domain-containing protein [Pontibacter sp. G13]WNJ18551.1 translocation/assembly module TamB domain-containing protein [Pontibacter sp. G13]